MVQSCSRAFAVVLVGAIVAPLAAEIQHVGVAQDGHTISGRVVDPHHLRPQDLTLMVGRRDKSGNSFGSSPVPFNADGFFVTPRLDAETYVLELIRTPHSPSKPAMPVGLTIVSLGTSDISNVTVEVRRDTALTGTFRMESDNPAAVWPPHINVDAYLALDGMTFLGSRGADGAPGGKFVLRNAFGPRVLRCGYTLAPGSRWWPSQVMLDGVDITNVPIDFSEREKGHLEVVFTQHPARIHGTVTDESGQPVRAPWILLGAADPPLRQHWSSMLEAIQGNTRGEFSLAVAPGRYLVAAVAQERFDSYPSARRDILPMTSNGLPVEIKTREVTNLTVRIQNR
jgi:hypothetical protein